MVTKLSNEAELKAHLAEHGNVSNVTLQAADLRGADLRGAYLDGANLDGADLQRANLDGADLYMADLQRANLSEADLRGADLYGADLYEANLYMAYLRGVDLRGADLQGANLYGAYLYGADLRMANLDGVTMNWMSHDLVSERLRQAASDDVLLRLGAGYILMSHDFCHEQLIKHAPNIGHPEHGTVMKWVLKMCISWRKEGDDFPEILQQAYVLHL